MKHILIGNGLIIQYGGSDYLNTNIINRTMTNAKNGNYEDDMKKTISPDKTYKFFIELQKEAKSIIRGEYDKYAITNDEKNSLQDFHERYPYSSINIKHIGFEDYFLILNLIQNRFKETIEDKHAAKIAMKRLFLDSIYNYGKINDIYKSFPIDFVKFISMFDTIFTVNYDLNIENASKKKVYHLHGQFDILEDVYDPDSFRNQLPDKPAQKFLNIPDEYKHTYCNAIMDYSKELQVNLYDNANSGMEKLVNGIHNGKVSEEEINRWENDPNPLLKNLYYGIKEKIRNPDNKFNEYPIAIIDKLNGEMHLLGLSPDNDTHILKRIYLNDDIEKIHYYYFTEREKQKIEKYFNNKVVSSSNVQKLWDSFSI